MRSYLKNKNFIPSDYINQMNHKVNKSNTRAILILILLNIIILPNSVNKLVSKEEESKDDIVLKREVGIESDNIVNWINLINKDLLKMQIQNNTGTIEIKEKNEIYKIESIEEVKINSIIKGENESFILGVSL